MTHDPLTHFHLCVPVLSSYSPGRRLSPRPRRRLLVINSHLTMADHVTAVCRAAYGLLSSATTMPDHKITVRRCSNDARAEFY